MVKCYDCKGLHAWLVVPAGSWSLELWAVYSNNTAAHTIRSHRCCRHPWTKSASASWIWYWTSSPELARTNRLLLYFTGTQVNGKKDYGSCCRLGSVRWLGHWPIVLMRRLLGLSHSCLLLNPYLITIYELHLRIMFCKFEWIAHVVIYGSYLQVAGTVSPTAT